jgi:nucleoside-diphosphate kinase
MDLEQTFFAIKPDGLKYSATGYVLTIMSRTNLIYAGAKVVRVNDLLAREHYAEHQGKPFFEDIVKYIKGETHYHGEPRNEYPYTDDYRRVLAFVYHGPNAVEEVREAVGPTNPIDARIERPGSLRALGAVYSPDRSDEHILYENLVHASATPEDARREIQLWFEPREIPEPMRIFPVVRSKEYFFLTPDVKVTTEQTRDARCVVSPDEAVWEDDYAALSEWLSVGGDERALRRAIAKYTL